MSTLWIVLLIIGLSLSVTYIVYRSFFSAAHIAGIIRRNIEHYSIILSEDDKLLVSIHPETFRPLASVVKLIIAIEFAEQVAAGRLQKEELVPIEEPGKYHIPQTDGNAHKQWLAYLENKQLLTDNHMVSLWEIARGMIVFSSNANTEYLLDRLGIDAVNDRLFKLGFTGHSHIRYLVSELYLTTAEMQTNTDKELNILCNTIHERLRAGIISADQFDYNKLTLEKQQLLNNRMPGSTAMEYYELLKKIISNSYFTDTVQAELNSLIERRSQPGRYDIIRYGGKGGSTLWVLNNAVYLERQNGKQYVFILFSNYPTEVNDNLLISKAMAKLIGDITTDTPYAKKLIGILNG